MLVSVTFNVVMRDDCTCLLTALRWKKFRKKKTPIPLHLLLPCRFLHVKEEGLREVSILLFDVLGYYVAERVIRRARRS
jgi:hypothetical protein